MGKFHDTVANLRAALTLTLAGGCAFAALAAQGGRVSSRLDVLTHFAPFWLAGGLAAVALALLARREFAQRLALSLGVVATVAAASLILPEFLRPAGPRAPADAPHQLKLIQFNVWGRNSSVDEERIARWIADQDADIVVVEELKGTMKAALRRHAPDYHLSCDRWVDCSTAVLSRARPIAFSVPHEEGLPGVWAPIARATFRAPDGGTFTVVGVHYTWPTKRGIQQAQGRRLAVVLDEFRNDRLILAGDFNSTPWSFSRRREDAMFGLERRTRALFSWPAAAITRFRVALPFAFLPIDQVYAGSGWRTVNVERGPALGSDHFPVVVTLALADSSAR